MNATKHARGNADVVKKREELQRRIEETRRKLQSVSDTSFSRKKRSKEPRMSHDILNNTIIILTGWL